MLKFFQIYYLGLFGYFLYNYIMCHVDSFHAKYRVLEKIGEGSFSEVLKCLHKTSGTLYAAKRLKKYYKSESSILTCAEVVAAQKVTFHTNILNMFEYHYDSFSGQVTFIFELMDMSLYDYLRQRKKSNNTLKGVSEHKAKEYLYQLLRGLEHLHRNGLFHRDVKPENILIKFPSIESTRLLRIKKHEVIKLADLGSVRGIYSMPPYTEYISTRWYRSPECLLTNGNYGPKMDVWATGCVFFEMITLLPLFPGSNEIDQLSKIHQILGSPAMQFLNKLKSRSRNCVVFPKIRGTGVDSLLPQISRQGRIILELMIEYDPDKRINVRRLLKNPYFDDIRYKYEPTMEGTNAVIRQHHSWHKTPEYGKRSIADTSLSLPSVKHKIIKKDHTADDLRRGSHSSAKSDSKGSLSSSKSQTPSIEIPYYAPRKPKNSSKHRISSMPLVDYKISRCVEDNQVQSAGSNKSCSLSRKSSIKRSVEIILKSSRNSESNKTPTSKSKVDSARLHHKSLPASKNGYHKTDSRSEGLKRKIAPKNEIKNKQHS